VKVYISGPISGYPNRNEVAFRQSAMYLLGRGYYPLVPHDIPAEEHEGPCPPGYATTSDGKHSSTCELRADLKGLLDCEAIYMLSGWEKSIGARLEFTVATHSGLLVFYQSAPAAPDLTKEPWV
jgi:hypothetical protein